MEFDVTAYMKEPMDRAQGAAIITRLKGMQVLMVVIAFLLYAIADHIGVFEWPSWWTWWPR